MAIEDRNLTVGTRLVASYRKQAHACMVEKANEGGGIVLELEGGKKFKSASAAASAVMGGKAVNGWTPLRERPRVSKCPTTNATATPQNCSSTTTSAWRTRKRDSSCAGLRSGSHHTRVTYAHVSPWHAERPVPGCYSATRDSEQAAAPATFSPATRGPTQQTCASREERPFLAGSSFRRGRSGRACSPSSFTSSKLSGATTATARCSRSPAATFCLVANGR